MQMHANVIRLNLFLDIVILNTSWKMPLADYLQVLHIKLSKNKQGEKRQN